MTGSWELSLDALARSGRPQSRPLMWLLSCFAPGNRIPLELITGTEPAVQAIQPVKDLLASGGHLTTRPWTESCMAGLQGLQTVGLIQRSDCADGSAGIELHPFIAEVTRAVMDSSEPAQTGNEPHAVRECAATVIQAALDRLDPGNAEHWPSFRMLTPHVIDLLASTAPHLDMKHRRMLLNAMERCITSCIWARAERRVQHLATSTLALAFRLAAGHEPVYQRLRHLYAWSLREQGSFPEAEILFREVLAEQARLPGGQMCEDALRTRHDLAWTIGRQGDWPAAEQQLRDVLRLRRQGRQQRGENGDDPDILHTRCMLYWSIGQQGRWAEAEGDYRQLTADRPQSSAPAIPTPWTRGKTSAKRWPGKGTGRKPSTNGVSSRHCARQPLAIRTPIPSGPASSPHTPPASLPGSPGTAPRGARQSLPSGKSSTPSSTSAGQTTGKHERPAPCWGTWKANPSQTQNGPRTSRIPPTESRTDTPC